MRFKEITREVIILIAIIMLFAPDIFTQSLSHKQIAEIRQSLSSEQTTVNQRRAFSTNQENRSVWQEKAWWAAITGSAADFTVSAARIDGIHIREANPLFRKNGSEFAWGRNLAFSGAILSVEYLIWRKHKSAGRKLMWITAGSRGGVAIYGLAIGR